MIMGGESEKDANRTSSNGKEANNSNNHNHHQHMEIENSEPNHQDTENDTGNIKKTTTECGESSSKTEPAVIQDALSSQRVFKKTSPNNKLTLYLSSRDLVVTEETIDKVQGVLLVDPDFVDTKKVFGQVTLTFRYGREDEEVMGLKFCNEAVMCLAQLYPPPQPPPPKEGEEPHVPPPRTPLQEALIKRLGPNAYPFTMEITPLAPPSVQLVPAKEYNGAPIGTSYDIRAYVADRPDEKLQKKTTVRMGIRVVQRAMAPPSPHQYVPGGDTKRRQAPGSAQSMGDGRKSQATAPKMLRQASQAGDPETGIPTVNGSLGGSNNSTPCKIQKDPPSEGASDNESSQMEHIHAPPPPHCHPLPDIPPPHATIDKPFLLSDGRVCLEASLDKAIYSHGEPVKVRVRVRNASGKTVRRIKIFVVQYVDVCMFSNGKFKNVVAMVCPKDDCPVCPGNTLDRTYALQPSKGATKNWIALEDSYSKSGTSLASTVTCKTNNPEDRNVFAIYVSYYVKVKLLVSVMGGELSLKLPFTLMHTCPEYDSIETISNITKSRQKSLSVPNTESIDVRPDKDDTKT